MDATTLWAREMRNISRARAKARLVLGLVPEVLSERERELVKARYGDGLNWRELANRFGVSNATVRRWHDELLDKVAAL